MLFDTASKLPPYERVHVLVLVHGLLHADEEAFFFQAIEVFVQVRIIAVGERTSRRFGFHRINISFCHPKVLGGNHHATTRPHD